VPQVTACHGAAGIPAEDTAQLLGNVSPAARAELWATRRLFFCTPQSFANDIASGAVDALRIVLVVFDEAHRASGASLSMSLLLHLYCWARVCMCLLCVCVCVFACVCA
jgi:ERCC4-related helicase